MTKQENPSLTDKKHLLKNLKGSDMKRKNAKKKDDFSLMGTPLSGDRDLDMAIFFGIENG